MNPLKGDAKKSLFIFSSFPGPRTLDPPIGPPLTWAEIFRRMCLQSHLQTYTPTPQKSYPKFRNPRTTFENTPLYYLGKPSREKNGTSFFFYQRGGTPPPPPLAKFGKISVFFFGWGYPTPPWFGKRPNYFRFFLVKASLRSPCKNL
jgi:hypothetical protein